MANVVAICGSLRKGSFNRHLMNASIGLAPEGMTIKEAPSFAKLPIYNFDDQQSTGFPKDCDALHEAVRAADGVLIVSAEYNWSIPGGPEERHRLAVALQGGVVQGQAGAASSRRRRGCSAARACSITCAWRLQAIDAQLFGKPEVIVNMAANKFADGKLTDQGAIDLIKQQLAAFGKFIERVKVR